MKAGPLRLLVVLVTSLSIACGGRGCSRAPSTESSPTSNKLNSNASVKILEPFTQAQAALDTTLQGPTENLTREQLAARVETTLDSLSDVLKQIPQDTFSPEAVLAKVGRDPNSLLQWVTNETQLVPYRGVLRGPTGVLMDRSGNSLDRSLLLADLLKRVGHRTRLAHAELPPEVAEHVMRQVNAAVKVRQSASADVTESAVVEVLGNHAKRTGGQPDRLKEAIAGLRQLGQGLRDDVQKRTDAATTTLLQLAKEQLAELPDGWKASDLKAVADHWWVQVEVGGNWINLDPLASLLDRSRLPTAEATIAAKDLDDEIHHRVRISVGVECQCAGGLEERSLLERQVRVSNMAGSSITLSQGPTAIPPSDIATRSASDVAAWLNSQEDWVVGLTVGSSETQGMRFTTAGQVLNLGAKPSAAGGLIDAFSGGDETPPGRLTAEFIDYEVLVPGEASRKERRYIFDWIGKEARANRSSPPSGGDTAPRRLELATQVEILILGAQPSPAFISYHTGRNVLLQRTAILKGLKQIQTDLSALKADSPGPEPFTAELYQLAAMRMTFSRYEADVFLAAPTILTRHEGLTVSAMSEPLPLNAFDIVENPVRVRQREGLNPVLVSVNQGVVDSYAELLLASTIEPSTSIADEMLVDSDPNHWRLMESDGSHIVRPTKSDVAETVSRGWWRIDSSRGTVLAFTARGWGGTQGFQETGFTTSEAGLRTMNAIGKLLGTLVCIFYQSYKASKPGTPAATKLGSVAMCLITGITSATGGIIKGALGQALSNVGTYFGIGWAVAALLHGLYKAFGGMNFSSGK